MGILHSTSRFFGCKTEDEEEKGGSPISPYLLRCNGGGDSSEELPKSSACSSILSAILQRFRFLFRFVWRQKTANHLLPIQNTSREPLLGHRSQRGTIDVLSFQQIKEERDRDLVPSVPRLTIAFNSNEGRSRRGIDEQRDRDALLLSTRPLSCKNPSYKEVASSSTVSVRKDAPRNVGMKKADREEKQVTSSSTVAVRKDAPRNVPIAKERLGMKKEEKKVSIRSGIINERWIKHYSSRHRILLVGEGDFSFSASLALAFSSASNIIATSLDSQEFLKKNYSRAASNIEQLRRSESRVMHEVDATKMANHPSLGHVKFDRIIYNFPYAGLANIKNLSRESQLRCHRRLVSQFLKNAREMISENGEIHISHKTNGFHVEFKLESIASSHRLRLIEAVDFNCLDYPGYNTKYGFGGDNNFNCSPSKTYKFGIKKLQYY